MNTTGLKEFFYILQTVPCGEQVDKGFAYAPEASQGFDMVMDIAQTVDYDEPMEYLIYDSKSTNCIFNGRVQRNNGYSIF